MSRSPQPRPALQKAADGSTHPAAPQAAAGTRAQRLVAAVKATEPEGGESHGFRPGDLRARKAAASDPPKVKKSERVDLGAAVPKTLRKQVRKKARDEGWSVDQAVTYVLRAWVDDR